MKIKQDDALTLPNPRLLTAVYFSLLAIIVTIVMDLLLYAIGVEQFLPISKAIFLSVIVAACFGALFGKRIILTEKPYIKHTFLWACLMVITALPFYNIGFIYLLQENHASLFAHATMMNFVYLYLFVLLYSFILAGVWLAIIAGLAAIYLRKHLVYYILQSKQQSQEPEHSDEATIDSDTTIINDDDTK